MENSLNRFNNYFYQLSSNLKVPKGYHQINYYFDKGGKILDVVVKSISTLKGVNKIVPYIINNFHKVNQNLLYILRTNKSNFDYIFVDYFLNEDNTEIKIQYQQIITYLNPSLIPIELLRLISDFLGDSDYNNYVEVLNLINYPHLADYFNRYTPEIIEEIEVPPFNM